MFVFFTRDSYEWIHVICAWWVPEVKIEDVKFIERIRKDKIPVRKLNVGVSGGCPMNLKSGNSVRYYKRNQEKFTRIPRKLLSIEKE